MRQFKDIRERYRLTLAESARLVHKALGFGTIHAAKKWVNRDPVPRHVLVGVCIGLWMEGRLTADEVFEVLRD